jgi:hypothetical protein
MNQMEHQGGYEALLYHLLHEVSLSGFVLEAPKTAFLNDVIRENLLGVDSVFFECLCSGEIPGIRDKKNDCILLRASDLRIWAEHQNKNDRGWNTLTNESIGRLFGPKGMNFPKGQPQGQMFGAGDGRVSAFMIPGLKACREKWHKIGKPTGDWNDQDDTWSVIPQDNRRAA